MLGGGASFTIDELWDLVFSPLHIKLRLIDGLLRLACLLYIGSPICTKALEEKYKEMMTIIQNAYINRPGHKDIFIKFARPDGGNTINGKIYNYLIALAIFN